MKQIYLIPAIILLTFTLSRAQMEEYKLNQPFLRFSNETAFDVFLEQGEQESVKVVFIQKVQKGDIHVEIVGNTLEIRQENKLPKKSKAKIYVTYKELDAISNHGPGNIISLSDLNAKIFEIKSNGPGNIRLSLNAGQLDIKQNGTGNIDIVGKAITQHVTIAGPGNYKAYKLKSINSDIEINGPGSAEVNVEKLLSIDISGPGNVHYIGSPHIDNVHISGFGNLKKVQ